MRIAYDTITCKLCGSSNIVRDGIIGDCQRWECRDCERKFLENDALPRWKTPANQISSALSMYYEGMSLNAIRRHLLQEHQNCPSDSTVYDWVIKFSKKAVERTATLKPEVGNVWVADETMITIDGQKVWFWDLIDTRTRFLLASHLSKRRTIFDAQTIMRKSQIKAGKIPKVIITDKLASYFEGVERAWHGGTGPEFATWYVYSFDYIRDMGG